MTLEPMIVTTTVAAGGGTVSLITGADDGAFVTEEAEDETPTVEFPGPAIPVDVVSVAGSEYLDSGPEEVLLGKEAGTTPVDVVVKTGAGLVAGGVAAPGGMVGKGTEKLGEVPLTLHTYPIGPTKKLVGDPLASVVWTVEARDKFAN